MKLTKLLSFALCLCLLFLSGCTKKENSPSVPSPLISDVQTTGSKQFSLLYFSGDSVNPYTATTLINRQLSLLLYDPLVRLTPDFQPEYVLAESIEIAGKQVTVALKNASFSDGSPVTSEDVVYSYNLAKASSTSYASELSEISSIKTEGEATVVITAKKADPYIANVLTFPILKKGSDKLTDQNKIALPPIGSGRYVPDLENLILNSNSNHPLGSPSIPCIYLINTPDGAVADYNLENGNVGIYSTDLSNGVVPSFAGNTTLFSLNRVVYIGINLNDSKLKDEKLRYAISAAIDRNLICENAYFGYADPAKGIFDSVWEDAKGLQSISSSANSEIMVAYLEELGYNSKDEEGFAVDSKGKRLSFTLVYYNGNERRAKAAELIAEQLKSVGIEITQKPLDWDAYVSALQSGRFDLYVAETKLKGNMDITELVTPGGALAYGIPKPKTEATDEDDASDETTDSAQTESSSQATLISLAVDGFYNEEMSLIDIINAFNAEMPIVPICHPKGLTVSDQKLSANNVSSVYDAYFGISDMR